MRCLDYDKFYVEDLVYKCLSLKLAKYDTQFSLGVEALYCSELCYQSDFDHRLKVDLSDLAGLGRPYISPMGLLFSKNCRCVFDSNEVFTGLMGSEIEQLVAKGIK